MEELQIPVWKMKVTQVREERIRRIGKIAKHFHIPAEETYKRGIEWLAKLLLSPKRSNGLGMDWEELPQVVKEAFEKISLPHMTNTWVYTIARDLTPAGFALLKLIVEGKVDVESKEDVFRLEEREVLELALKQSAYYELLLALQEGKRLKKDEVLKEYGNKGLEIWRFFSEEGRRKSRKKERNVEEKSPPWKRGKSTILYSEIIAWHRKIYNRNPSPNTIKKYLREAEKAGVKVINKEELSEEELKKVEEFVEKNGGVVSYYDLATFLASMGRIRRKEISQAIQHLRRKGYSVISSTTSFY